MIYALPQAFLARMQTLLGAEYETFAAAYSEPPVSGVRYNPLKVTEGRFRELFLAELEALAWCPSGFRFEADSSRFQPGKQPWHAAGVYYLQEPAAMAAAEVLAPQPGERVLDLAAAPGGKSTQIAGLLGGRGVLVANEVHPRRAWDLAENLERWGAGNVSITQETPERLAERLPGYFDRVLLDAPCSGEGMFRKSAAARQDWSVGHVQACARRQAGILEAAGRLVRLGGRLVYVTCTFAPEEDEGVIAGFLESHPEFEIETVALTAGMQPGRPEWAQPENAALSRAVRMWPHQGGDEGHFIAALRRVGGAASNGTGRGKIRPAARLPKDNQAAWEQFAVQRGLELPGKQLRQVGTYLYAVPEDAPDLEGLRVIHPGLWLGAFKPGRFEPAHALALLAGAEEAGDTLHLEPEDGRLGAYLRGETIESAGTDGWVKIAAAEFGLGWGKRVQGRVKSHYPRGLRQV